MLGFPLFMSLLLKLDLGRNHLESLLVVGTGYGTNEDDPVGLSLLCRFGTD